MTKHQKYIFFFFFDLLYFIITYFTYELFIYINYNDALTKLSYETIINYLIKIKYNKLLYIKIIIINNNNNF